MPLLDGLFGKPASGPVALPIAAHVPVSFRVYYTPGYPPFLPEDLRTHAAAWAEAHVEEPLRSALLPILASAALSYTDMAKTAFPPPLDLLQHADVGEEERTRFEKAWQVTVVASEATAQVPMFGLWAAIAAGRSAALDLKGALFDAPAVRLTAIASYEMAIPGNGAIRVEDHVAFPSDPDPSGYIRWHTTGMCKFGLPELVLPADPGHDLGPALRVLAQQVLDSLLRANHGRPQPLTDLVLAPVANLALATGPAQLNLHLASSQAGVPTLVAVPA